MNSPTPSPVTIAPKPCPFCGSTPKLSGGGMFYACPNIHCTIHDYAVELEDWNRRQSAGEDVKASPVVPVLEKLEELEAKLRAQCKTLATGEPDFSDGVAAGKQECADDIAQLIKEAKGG